MLYVQRSWITLLLLCAVITVNGQTRKEKQYQEEADKIKSEIWNAKDPAFAVTTVPDASKNESAVILAKSIVLTAGKRRGTAVDNMTLHERIRIQDKASLENYSEFNLQKLKKSYGNSILSYMGLKIVKPDGAIQEIDMKEAVTIKDEKQNKKQKIAIPDLQVGDILDYYIRITEENRFSGGTAPVEFSIGEKYPMLYFSLDLRIASRIGLVYNYMNAPEKELKISHDDDDDILTITKTNVPKVTDEQWLYEKRALPTLRLCMHPVKESLAVSYYVTRRGEMKKGLDENRVKEYLTNKIIGGPSAYNYDKKTIKKDFRKVRRKYKKKNHIRKLGQEAHVALMFYYLRYNTLYKENGYDGTINVGNERNFYSPNQNYSANILRYLLNKNHIPCKLVAAVPRGIGELSDAVSQSDLEYFIAAYPNKKEMYCYLGNMFSYPGQVPARLEGQQAYSVKVTGNPIAKSRSFSRTTLPVSDKTVNVTDEKLQISFNETNMQQVNIQRDITVSGHYRHDYQANMLLYEDLLKAEHARLKTHRSLVSEYNPTNSKRQKRKRAPEYEVAFAKARKEMQTSIESGITSDYNIKPLPGVSYKIKAQGLEHSNPQFTMQQTFSLDGLIKKAGNNYMMDIGKLITAQIELTPEQRKRIYDIYMPFARSVSYEISLAIPAGYQLEGIENLNKSVTNNTGGFISNARLDGSKFVIKILKTYNHAYEPVANWADMVSFLDAAADFTKQKVLLKKI